MEEARQHPALSFERFAWALVYFAGPLALSFGILSTFAIDHWGILIGVFVQAISKVVIAIWSISRPEVQLKHRPPAWRIAQAAMWSAISLIFVTGELGAI